MKDENLAKLRRRLADLNTREAVVIEVGDWARGLCLSFGSQVDTAYSVGGVIALGLLNSWNREELDAAGNSPLSH